MREIKVQMEIERDGEVWIMTNSLFDIQNGMCYHELGHGCKINWYRQYTGLKDKNGVEIYEGDILQFSNNAEWYKNTFMFADKETRQQIVKGEGEYKFERRIIDMPNCYDWLLSSEIQIYWEIIGNIYQNEYLIY